MDSTPLCVCKNIRIPRYPKQDAASHQRVCFMVSSCNILSFCLTRGNVDDRVPEPYLVQELVGKLFGDRSYISKKLTELLETQDIELITTLKKNMKPIAAFDKLILRKRSIIETINDQLKNVLILEHSRHRSLINFLMNAIASLVAYSYQTK